MLCILYGLYFSVNFVYYTDFLCCILYKIFCRSAVSLVGSVTLYIILNDYFFCGFSVVLYFIQIFLRLWIFSANSYFFCGCIKYSFSANSILYQYNFFCHFGIIYKSFGCFDFRILYRFCISSHLGILYKNFDNCNLVYYTKIIKKIRRMFFASAFLFLILLCLFIILNRFQDLFFPIQLLLDLILFLILYKYFLLYFHL